MADERKIIPFTRIPARPTEPSIEAVDRHELMIEELRAELRGELFSLHRTVEQQKRVLQVHHESLVNLTAVLHGIQERSWRGRIRRTIARLEAFGLWCRGWAVELGAADPFDVHSAEAERSLDAACRADENPEAMPKP